RAEVVCAAEAPRAQRAAVRLPPGALEVPIGLEKGLLGDVLRVVVVPDPVVRVRVHVTEVVAVEVLERAVELGLRLPAGRRNLFRVGHNASVPPPVRPISVMPLSSPARPAARVPSTRRARSRRRSGRRARRGPRSPFPPCAPPR